MGFTAVLRMSADMCCRQNDVFMVFGVGRNYYSILEIHYMDFTMLTSIHVCILNEQWYDYSVPLHAISDSRPTIQELQTLHYNRGTLKIIQSTAAKWNTLAIELNFDEPVIRSIERDTHCKCEDACHEMFVRWLRTKRVNWQSLISALDAID